VARFLFYLDRRVVLEEGREVVVGRSGECDVCIENDRSMSRRHAKFWVRGETVWVEDLGSRNGVVLNGRAVSGPAEVSLGDRVLVGGHVFQVVDEQDLRRTRRSGRMQAIESGEQPLHFDEVTDISPPQDLIERAATEHASGELSEARRHLVRFAGAAEMARARGRPATVEVLRRGGGLMLQVAAETADVVWVERALGIYGDARLLIPDDQLVLLANLVPVLGDVRPSILRYVDAIGPGGDRAAQVTVAKLRALTT
jgi:hypothetical protein